jgi:hypothetical protein
LDSKESGDMATLPQHEFDFGTSLILPTQDDVEPGSRRLNGCYVRDDSAEATFVPPQSFLEQDPLWRIDVLQDLMHDFELVRRHAIVEWAHSLSMTAPEVDESKRLEAFRSMCDQMGVHVPENLEALLVLSERLKAGL